MRAARTACCGGVLFALIAWSALPGYAEAPPSGPDLSVGAAAAAPAAKIDLSDVRARAEQMPIDKRKDIDKRIAATVERVNKAATEKGQAVLASRLASEFDMTPEALLDEKGEQGLSWGEIMIAHTLLANSDTAVSLADLMTLRAEGLGWGAIAFGLRFHLEDFEATIKAEGRVAMGLSQSDGKAPATGK